MTKRVVVQMSDECHSALKQYAAFYDMTMSEVLYNCTRMQFHSQSLGCQFVENMLDKLQINLDKRASKECFSFLCFSCKHMTACKTGYYKGVVEFEDTYVKRDAIKPVGKKFVSEMQMRHGQQPQWTKDQWPEEDEGTATHISDLAA